jgi:hypothetical protein
MKERDIFMKDKMLLLSLVALSIFILPLGAGAEPIPWTTEQYTAYAYSVIWDYRYGTIVDEDTQYGPPLPILASSYVSGECWEG